MESIKVIPDIEILGRCNAKRRPIINTKIDRDVETIKNEDLDVTKMSGQTTKEESNIPDKKDKKVKTKIPWLIIGLSFVVIILIIIIVWYVLKQNEKYNDDIDELPSSLTKPSYVQHNKQPTQQHSTQYTSTPNMNYSQFVKKNHNEKKIRTESMPVQSTNNTQTFKQPTKNELETALSLCTIEEGDEEGNEEGGEEGDRYTEKKKKIIPSKTQKKADSIKKTKDDNDNNDDEKNLDKTLADNFYSTLQNKLESDEADSDEEEGRNVDKND
jgi:hypothetical protein